MEDMHTSLSRVPNTSCTEKIQNTATISPNEQKGITECKRTGYICNFLFETWSKVHAVSARYGKMDMEN
jgi:hypothetical protein